MKTTLNQPLKSSPFFQYSSAVDRFRLLLKGWSVKVFSLLMVLMVGGSVVGQTTVTIGGGATVTCPATPTATYSTPPTGVIFSNWSRGSGVICASVSGALTGTNFLAATASGAAGVTANKFYSISITTDATKTFTLSGITWATTVSGSGGTPSFAMMYSNNGGSVTQFGTTGTSQSSNSFSGSVVVAANTTLVLYFVPLNVAAVGATVRLVNGSTITGTATSVTTAPLSPTINSITPGNQQLSVAFTAGSNGGSAITTYKYSTNSGINWQTRAAGTTASPLVISTLSTDGTTALTNGTSYNVQIKAVNGIGDGAATASTAATPRTIPDAPTIGTASVAGVSGTANIPFTAPGSNGGSAITSYTVTSNPTGVTGTGTSSPISVSGLSNGTAYTFTITATNAAGTGAASTASNSVTPYTVPGVPTIGTATVSGVSGTASVSFTAPVSNGGSTITSYTATSSPGGLTGTLSQAGSGTITVSGLTNGTAYTFTVKATNAGGASNASSASNAVTPYTVPDSPTIGTAVSGNTTASVTFAAPGSNGGSAITGYTVTSNPDNLTGTGSSSPITVNGLTNGTAYTFTITATNAAGTGATSAASNSVTPTSGPTVPDAPTSIVATFGNASASVDFTAPVSDGGSTITSYTATSTPGGLTGVLTQAGSGTITVNGLTNGTSYTFTVLATNGIGNSLPSAVSNSVTPATTPDAPTIGTATAGNTTASVAFTAPVSNGGSTITGYTVTSNPGNITSTGSASPILVTGLTNGTSYTFTVTATNTVGTSSVSNTSNSVTPASTPGAPTITSITPGNGQLSVAFTAPGSNGGSAITNYKYSINGGTLFTACSPTQTSGPIVITGLTNGIACNVQIKAVNVIGDGAATASTSATPATTPSAPTITSITPGNGQLTINFSAGATGGSAITNYKYSTDGGNTFTAVSPAQTNTTPIVITGLTNNTTYNVQLKAVNAMGDGTATSSTSGTPSLYCASTGPASQGSDYFTNFTTTGGSTNINNTSTFSANGYGNFTAQTVTQYQGGTINYSATSPGISNGSTFSIFVDWNQDGDFTDSGEGVVALGVSSQISSNPSGSFIVPVGATPGNTRMRIIIKDAAGAITSCNSALAHSETEDYTFNTLATSTPPTLTAASSPTVDAAFNVTFSDDATWRAAITSITVGGTTLSSGYSVTAGQIAFTPFASSPASLLQSSGSKSIVVIATGYANATVTQSIGFGAATKLAITTQPTAPVTNGAVLAAQPVVAIQDQYGNTVTSDNSTLVTAAVSSGSWAIGGTLVKTAVSGVTTFNDITASSNSAVISATIGFTSSPTYTSTISTPPFAIPSPDYISLTGLGIAATENFNSLATSGTSSIMPQGWSISESGSNANTSYTADAGSGTAGETYSYGSGTSTDRAFGSIASSNLLSVYGTKIKNTTGTSINSINIFYVGEQWRKGASVTDRLDFQYSTNATSLTNGSWTDVNALDFSSLQTGSAGALDGNLSVNRITLNSIISGLSIANNTDIWIRWVDVNISGNDDGLAIDDFSISGCNNLPSTSNLSLSGASTIAGNGAVVTVTSSTLADGNYTVTYNVSGTNTVASTTATMTFASGTGTFTTSTLSSTGNANLVNITSIAFTSVTGCSSSVSASSAAFNTVSTSVAYSNTQFTTARNIIRGTTELPIYCFQVDVTNAAATLSSLGFTTPATAANGNSSYVNTDITNFKAFLTTSTTFSNSTQLGSTSPSGKTQQNAGETLINFTSLATTLNVGTTYYIWLTADVLSTAVAGRTIIVNAPTIGITGAVSGTNSATGTQTIISVATNYYLNSGGSLSTSSNYYTSPNGVGTTLSAAGLTYTSNDVILNIPVSVTNTSDFTLGNGSKIVVQNGGSLTVGASNTITGTIDVNDGGTLTVNNTSVLHTLGTLGTTSSTVIYNANGNQTVAVKPYANLTISGSGVKTIGAATVSGTLNLNNGTLDIGSSTFVINGPVSQSSGLIDADAGTLSFGNSVDMSLLSSLFSGDIYNLSKSSGAGILTVNDNLNITNNLSTSSSTGALVLASTKQLTVDGIITNNGTFTIENGATLVQTGIGANANSGNGTYNVKQAITGSGGSTPNDRFWYLGAALSDASSTALLSSAGSQLWQWNESNFNYALVPTGQQLAQGKSYVLRSGQNEIINFSGASLSNGTVNVTGLTRTGTTQTYRGCHLISNPYPSYLDWNAISKTNIGSTMYVRTAVGSTFDVMETYNSVGNIATNNSGTPLTQYIAPMQGFWVKVPTDGQTGSLTMDNSMRSHQPTGAGLRSTPQDFPAFLRFNMLDGQNKDQVILLMSPDASMSLDAFDSEKMSSSGYAQFYSTVNAKKLVINGMKNVKAKTSVPLTLVMPTSKSYTFQAEEFNIEDGLILLEDKQEGVIQDLTVNPTYSFFGNAGTNATRFVVHFQLATAPVLVGGPQELESLGSDELMSDNIQIVSNNQGTVIIRLDEGFKPEGNIRIFDASGRLVEQTDFKDQETTIQLNEQSGLYFVEVSAGKLMVKKKIVIE
jgi:trimeric autotransporter adhesin